MRTFVPVTLALVMCVSPLNADTHILGGMEPGEFAVTTEHASEESGYLLFKVKELDPDSVYFFPRKPRWWAYIVGGNATTWATCYGMSGWMPLRSTETPGYIALEHRGVERYGVTFVYQDSLWNWDGTYDFIVKQE